MRRAIIFLLKLAVVLAIALWLADRPGAVEIAWEGYIVETSVGVLIAAVFLLMVLAAVLYHAWRGLVRAPAELARARGRRRRARGYRALTNGMVAVAAGDTATAARYARRADALLREPPLTMLLSAQAAQLAGDDGAAERYFRAMLSSPETEFLGLRGLISQALRRDDLFGAHELVSRARSLRPGTDWVAQTGFEIEVRLRRWAEALETIDRLQRGSVWSRAEADRARAAVLLEQSREAEAGGGLDTALDQVRRAVALRPDFVPAVAREARLLARLGRARQAEKVVEAAWRLAPHPDLAAGYRDLARLGADGAPEEPLATVRRMTALAECSPGHPESLLAQGEAELGARLYGAARTRLGRAAELAPGARAYRLLARLEEAERDDPRAARDWLLKADAAPPEPVWRCRRCGTPAPVWTATCDHCRAFDSIAWARSGADLTASPPASPTTPTLEADEPAPGPARPDSAGRSRIDGSPGPI